MTFPVRFTSSAVLAAALGVLSSCDSPAPAPAESKVEKKAPPAPVSGQSALFEIYKAARQWTADVQILDIENIPIDSVKPQPGKYGAWQAVLVSPSKQQKRVFTYSVVEESATLHKDVFAQREEPYVPNPQVKSFPIQNVKTDSTAALETARKEAETAAYESKNPSTPIQYRLEWAGQIPQPAWRVIWGNSISSSGYSVYVSAVDGKYLKKAH